MTKHRKKSKLPSPLQSASCKLQAKYCQPIRAKTIKEIEKKASPEADIIEIWLDHLKEIDFKALKKLRKKLKKPFLYVCKDKFPGTETQKTNLLIESEGDYIDVDVKTPPKLIKKLKRSSKKLIISHHNFEKTPRNLLQLYKKMRSYKPDIIKFATKINKSRDIANLFSLIIKAQEDNQPIITLGMGEKGKITRILAPKLGNYLYYAPINPKDATAPGQLTYQELNEYWQTP